MKVSLVAVQAKMQRGDYATVQAFKQKIKGLMDQVETRAETGFPRLVVFPEYLGMYLSFLPRYWEELSGESSLERSIEKLVERHGHELEPPARSHQEAAKQLLFVRTALETETAYVETFSSLAREHHAYIVAGSLCLPEVDESPHRGGRVVLDGQRVYSQSYVFSPRGIRLGRTRKVNLPPGEDRLLDAASPDQLYPIQTSVGRIGTLLCFDGYHHSLLERLDGLRSDIVAQPLYFPNPDIRFDGTGKYTPHPEDFISMLQGRENIQFGVGAAQVGAVFEDQRAEGMSFIACNTGTGSAPWRDAVLAKSDNAYAETVVTATVDVQIR